MSRPSIGTAPNPNADPNAKDKFKNLDSDFKDAVASEDAEAIYKRVANLNAEIEHLDAAKKLDGDLMSAKDKYDTAVEPYKTQTKDLKLRIKFCIRVLGDQGKV
jgi:hypothetical protein